MKLNISRITDEVFIALEDCMNNLKYLDDQVTEKINIKTSNSYNSLTVSLALTSFSLEINNLYMDIQNKIQDLLDTVKKEKTDIENLIEVFITLEEKLKEKLIKENPNMSDIELETNLLLGGYIFDKEKVNEIITKVLQEASLSVGCTLKECKEKGIISSSQDDFWSAWCSIFTFSQYEKANFLTYDESLELMGEDALGFASYWIFMDDSKHYNGYLSNGTKSYGDLNYLPSVGDAIIYGRPWDSSISYATHVGLVYEVDEENGIIKTLEGNVGSSNDLTSVCEIRIRDYVSPSESFSTTPVTYPDGKSSDPIIGYFSLSDFLESYFFGFDNDDVEINHENNTNNDSSK